MHELQNLFESKEWLGVFFAPDDFSNRFPGNLKYSPEEGAVLEYLIPSHERIHAPDSLHGVLNDGRKCTLLGDFGMRYAGTACMGGQDTLRGRHGFPFIRIGGHYSSASPISEVIFSLRGLQEFFFREGFKSELKFNEHPEFKMDLRYGTLEVSHDATFNFVNEDIRPLFFSPDPSALDELQLCYERIRERSQRSVLMLKKDISYRLHLKFSSDTTVETAYEHIASLSRLFAILLKRPCHAERIALVERSRDGAASTHNLYPSLELSSETITQCSRTISNVSMPINSKSFDLEKVICAWVDSNGRFDDLVSPIQSDTGTITEHAIKGDILLYASQLESIAYANGESQRKYEYSIDNFSDFQLHEFLQKLMGVESIGELGEAIGSLRNEIAHIGRPKNYLKKLTGNALHRISLCLELIVLGYALDNLGVPKKKWKYYQVYFLPKW